MYFKNAKVGDKVWDYIQGSGKVHCLCDDYFTVTFENGDQYDFMYSGKSIDDDGVSQRLFYYDNRPIVITQDDLDLDGIDEYNLVPLPCYCRNKNDEPLDIHWRDFISPVKIGAANGINRTKQHTQFECPACHGIVNRLETYCKHCGVKFEWEDIEPKTVEVSFKIPKLTKYSTDHDSKIEWCGKNLTIVANEEIDLTDEKIARIAGILYENIES